jgi:hypothetical protein
MPSVRIREIDPRLAAILWIGLIYATIPFVRGLREAFAARWPAEIIGFAVMAAIAIAAAAAIASIHRSRRRIGIADTLWLLAVAAVSVIWTRHLMGQPEEAVHFIEYGILGILLYGAMERRVPDWTIYAVVVLTGMLVGTVDELIQWATPERFWDFRDIVLNGSAVALVQIAIWRLAPRPQTPVNLPSLRLLCRLAVAEVLLLTICLAATPARLARLSDHIPLPERMATGADAICEYGYRHTVDSLTTFRSRLSPQELASSDRELSARVARELDEARGVGGLTLEGVSTVTDPYGYEVRVHLFARNRNLGKALTLEPQSPDRVRHMTIAWRENLILEHSFGGTLAKSPYRWGPRRQRDVEAAQDPGAAFVSRVGAHLVTGIREGQLRALLLVLVAALLGCDRFLATRSRPESPPG